MATDGRPSSEEIRRVLAELMTACDIDDAMGWSPGTARRRRWRALQRGGLPASDAELGGVAIWFRSTFEDWQRSRSDRSARASREVVAQPTPADDAGQDDGPDAGMEVAQPPRPAPVAGDGPGPAAEPVEAGVAVQEVELADDEDEPEPDQKDGDLDDKDEDGDDELDVAEDDGYVASGFELGGLATVSGSATTEAVVHREIELHGQQVTFLESGARNEVPRSFCSTVWPAASATWRAVLPVRGRDTHTIAPDLLGHGRSAKPRRRLLAGSMRPGCATCSSRWG